MLKEFCDNLETVPLGEKHLRDNPECAVCKEVFELGNPGLVLRCGHVFHQECLITVVRISSLNIKTIFLIPNLSCAARVKVALP